MSSDLHISVVIPALNEAARIEATLRAVVAQPGPFDVTVVDGGSTDGTRALALALANVISAPRGRARQLNVGAASTTGDVLLFLHADTLLPPDAFSAIRATLADDEVVAGAFRLSFDVETPLLRFYSLCTHLALPRICFGDRGLFVRRTAFAAVHGFPQIPIFEDLEIVRLLHRHGRFRFLQQSVTTAARRFASRGPLRQQLLNCYLWVRYILGTSPHRLAPLYSYSQQEEEELPTR